MQLGWEDHFFHIVLPAWQAYLGAEARLTAAVQSGDPTAVWLAGYDALREGGAASFYLSHYADIIAVEQPQLLPPEVNTVRSVRRWVGEQCRMLRTERHVDDVKLLADVADALKHAHLTREPDQREVPARDAVLVLHAGYGRMGFGEGKYGGVLQVIVLARTGERALSSVLQNVVDAWRVAMRWPMPAIGQA